MRGTLFLVVVFMLSIATASAQEIAIKTNLLYGAYTYTPNLSVEIGLKQRSTLDIAGGYNPWNLKGSERSNKKAVHWVGNIEYRYWLHRKFDGHFFGAHVLATQYNIGGHRLPLLFGKDSKNFRHEGWAAGVGVSYGYQWTLGKHWAIEGNIGAGYAYMKYDKYHCMKCGDKVGNETHNYFGPTKAGVSLIYVF